MASIETVASPLTPPTNNDPSEPWKLTIKTVGKATINSRTANPFSDTASSSSFLKNTVTTDSTINGITINNDGESTFDIHIDPTDSLYALSRRIESVTGLEVGRQRLIYRGRILVVDYDDEEEEEEVDRGSVALKSSGDENSSLLCDSVEEGERGLSDLTCSTEDAVHESSPERSNSSNNLNSSAENVSLPITRQNSTSTLIVPSVSDYITQLQQREADRRENNAMEASSSSLATVYPVDEKQSTPTGSSINKKKGVKKQRICDIKGLKDGHTIHLVPRPAPPPAAAASSGSSIGAPSNTITSNIQSTTTARHPDFTAPLNTNEGGITSISGPEGMNLLAALLGISNTDTNEGSSSGGGVGVSLNRFDGTAGGVATATAVGTTPTAFGEGNSSRLSNLRLRPRGGATTSTARARAAAARLTEADVRARDPGSMEPVRQGLMTCHTLLGNALFASTTAADDDADAEENSAVEDEGKEEEKLGSVIMGEEAPFNSSSAQQQESSSSSTIPSSFTIHQLQSNRQWYRGQWLDALDTVNQWLEATVVDVVLPSEILNDTTTTAASSSCNNDSQPSNRERKLLRRRRTTPDPIVSANDLEGRRRLLLEPCSPEATTDGTQTSPTALEGGISTHNMEGYQPRPDNEGVQLLLIHYNGWPHRWDEWIRSDSERIRPFRTRTRHRATSQLASPTPSNVFQGSPGTYIIDKDDEIERVSLLPELHRVISMVNEILEGVIPFDRGMVVDTTPFPPSEETAFLPWSLPYQGVDAATAAERSRCRRRERDPMRRLDSTQLRRLAPLMDRLGRTLTDAAPHLACLADSLSSSPSEAVSSSPNPSSFSLMGEEVVPLQNNIAARAPREMSMNEWRSRMESINTSSEQFTSTANNQDEGLNDPDLTDYINGMVNTSRSVNRTDRNRDPLVAGLLSNYLSSQGGAGGGNENDHDENNAIGRLIRMGGTNAGRNGDGPGIDIHIHAVVTGTGMNSIGGLGGTGGVAAGTTTTPLQSILRNGNSSTNRALNGVFRTTAAPALNEEDQGLFSELYSESPTPLNLHGSSNTSIDESAPQSRELFPEFAECRSIEDESCESEDVEVTAPDVPALVADAIAALDVSDSIDDADEQKPAAKEVQTKTNDRASGSNPAAQAAPLPNDESERQDSNGSINTISEIGSVDSSPSSEPLQSENTISPSFTNRLFRRTLGRFGNNHRRAGGSST